jgi:ubiquinone/menaquinone biosynthesis C-methylase UbiE
LNHDDYVALLRPARLAAGGVWADLGAGAGAFTMALRELIGPEAAIYAVDADAPRLDDLKEAYESRFGQSGNLHLMPADLSKRPATPPLDGVLMANSLHFFENKEPVLRAVRTLLKPDGLLLLVEYNVDQGNMWVPYPLSFDSLRQLAPRAGYAEPALLATHPSDFLREFYSAAARKEATASP